MSRTDLAEKIRDAIADDPTRDVEQVAAQEAFEFFAAAIKRYAVGGIPGVWHTEACEPTAQTLRDQGTPPDEGTCPCGFEQFHYDLVWSLLLPRRRAREALASTDE